MAILINLLILLLMTILPRSISKWYNTHGTYWIHNQMERFLCLKHHGSFDPTKNYSIIIRNKSWQWLLAQKQLNDNINSEFSKLRRNRFHLRLYNWFFTFQELWVPKNWADVRLVFQYTDMQSRHTIYKLTKFNIISCYPKLITSKMLYL